MADPAPDVSVPGAPDSAPAPTAPPAPAPAPAAERSEPDAAPATVAVDASRVTLEVRFRAPRNRVVWEGAIRAVTGRVARAWHWPRQNRSQADRRSFTIRRGGNARNAVVPALYLTLDEAKGAVVELTPKQGEVRIEVDQIRADVATQFLDGRVEVRRVGTSTQLTNTPGDEDYPAAARGPDGVIHVAYVAYQRGTPIDQKAVQAGDFASLVTKGHGDRIFLARYDGKTWSAPLPVTQTGLDVQRPAVAVDAAGDVWVTWSQNIDGNWDLHQRRRIAADQRWSDIKRLTKEAGADISVVSTTDANGKVWWAWQGWRDDNFDVHLASSADAAPLNLSGTKGNEWNPAIAADGQGSVYVAWDSYDRGNYDVVMRRIRDGKPGPAIDVAATPRFEARVSIAVDQDDRVWIAHELAGVNWGKDYAYGEGSVTHLNQAEPLYLNRTVAVAVYADGRLQRTAGDVSAAWAGRLARNKSVPRLGVAGDGRVWLTFRTHPLAGGGGVNWASYATLYDGARWLPAQPVPKSDGLIDNRPVILADRDAGAVLINTSDLRLSGRQPRSRNADLFLTHLAADSAEAARPQLADLDQPEFPAVRPVHEAESDDVARLRKHRVAAAGKTYRLLRGEFHRHTEYTAHRDQDGLLEDMFRYALDAVAFEWIGNGDHDNGNGREYDWWSIQKVTSLYDHPGKFFPVFSYERSNRYPNGHRNVIFTRRGIRPLPRGGLPGTAREGTPDTKLLYQYLRHFDGICASHTSGTNMGTDWRDNDPDLEPIVEIYQGRRHSYEHFGAPRSATPATHIGGYQPGGYVWNALAKGIRFGFQSSSDHVSTHMSYAIVLAEEASRQAVFEAFQARRCYAATDNILLIVRSGEHLMGEEFSQSAPLKLEIEVVGTTAIAQLDIIRDNGYVYTATPNRAEVKLTWADQRQAPGITSYYYVRVRQTDGNLAWSSPLWVNYTP